MPRAATIYSSINNEGVECGYVECPILTHALHPRTHVSVRMLLGFDDTILGVGAPEVAIVLIVGYFVLGPVELFKLTKEAGVLVGQLRDLGLGTVTNLGNIMDEQVSVRLTLLQC